jgi:cytochrome c oxidase subunit I+III
MTTAVDARTSATPAPAELATVWARPPGVVGWLRAVNHKRIGMRFIVTAFVFLLVGGVEALLIRLQLAGPEQELMSPEAYAELFTLHGSTMMFLFAVPILEGLAMYLVPLMLGARDMPFPRLNAFGYWAYLFGGLFVYASLLAGEVPNGGWFAYVPLTGPEFSPGQNLDFWLLGVTFVELSGIVGAIELIVLILKHRAPGMSLDRMPVFVWATLVTAFMMLFAFTTLAMASTLLELERAYGWVFFDPARGGEPLLWQHLFWIFGHPEVYIMLLPAVGIVSMIVSTFARRPIIGYSFIVIALVGIGFVSFGLWVHHMFTVGIPFLTMSFFTAASMVIAIPSGIQIFAWIATLWGATVRWATPLLFVLGFVFIFVAGGITGVMVAMVPFDWQAHDSFFVVAHFHYVLVGGVLFPVFAGLHYWWPKLTGKLPSERLGVISSIVMFVGFNVAFFPQHILGLLGMPRRVHTYDADLGWGSYNMVSSIGAFVLAVGVLVYAVNLVRAWIAGPVSGPDPWEAGTLEWATPSPPPAYNFVDMPVVGDRDPLWRPAEPAREAAALQAALRTPNDGHRETWSTTSLAARLEELVLIARPSIWPLVTAGAITVALAGLLTENDLAQVLGIAAAVVAVVLWLWPTDDEVHQEAIEAEHDLVPPAPARRPGVWVGGMWGAVLAVVVVTTALGTFVFSYLRLVSTAEVWPPPGAEAPALARPAVATVLAVLATVAALWARRAVTRRSEAAAVVALGAATVIGLITLGVLWTTSQGLELVPDRHAFDAVTALLLTFASLVVAGASAASAFVLAIAVLKRRAGHPAVPVWIAGVLWAAAAFAVVVALATITLVPRLA